MVKKIGCTGFGLIFIVLCIGYLIAKRILADGFANVANELLWGTIIIAVIFGVIIFVYRDR